MIPTNSRKTKNLPTSILTGEVPGPPDEPPAAVGVGPSVPNQASTNFITNQNSSTAPPPFNTATIKTETADNPADSSAPRPSGPQCSPADHHNSTNQPTDTKKHGEPGSTSTPPPGGTRGRQADRPPPYDPPPRDTARSKPVHPDEPSAPADAEGPANPPEHQHNEHPITPMSYNFHPRSPSPVAGCSWHPITFHLNTATNTEPTSSIFNSDKTSIEGDVSEKAFSPAPAPPADVPAPTDEPSAVAGAGGPAPHRVSPTIRCVSPEQSYSSTPFLDNSPPNPPSHLLHNYRNSPERLADPPLNLIQPGLHTTTRPQISNTHSPGDPRPGTPSESGSDTLNSDNRSTLALQWNANGLRQNLGDLQVIIARHNPIVLAIQETHIPVGTDPTRWLGGHYTWELRTGGNIFQTVGLATRSDIPGDEIRLDTQLLAIARRILVPTPCTVATVYIPQEVQDVGKKLDHLIRQLPTPFLIMGDFNAHHLQSRRPNRRGNEILKTVENNGAIILNDGNPTFARGPALTHIDISICSSPLAPDCLWSVLPDSCSSDHHPILITHRATPPTTTRRRRWLYKEADWANFQETFTDQLDPLRSYTADELTDIIHFAAESSIPRTSGTPRRRAVHWWCSEVATAIKNRRRALRTLRKTPTDSPLWAPRSNNFRQLRNDARKAISEAKTASWNSFLDGIHPDSPTEEIWRRVNALSGKRRNIGFSLDIGGSPNIQPSEIANELGRYFSSLSANTSLPTEFQTRKNHLEANPVTFIPDSSAQWNQPFSGTELSYALNQGQGKATGIDNIGYPLLRNLPASGKRTLLECFSQIWKGGPIPNSWQTALVIQIPRRVQGPRTAKDFRPISLLPCISKTFERMANRRLTDILEQRQLLDNRQHAFRKGKGTGSYLASLGETLEQARRDGLHADIAALDIEKAYNTVWREGILRQLHRWGIGGNLGAYIQRFLQDRRFRVGIGASESGVYVEENGVPQGSVLAVTLFLISMNTIFATLPKGVFIFVYADDIVLVVTGRTRGRTRIKLQAAVNAVSKWATGIGFRLSISKSFYTHISDSFHRATDRPIRIADTPITYRKEPTILGITLDRKTTFAPHFRRIKAECANRINNILAPLYHGSIRSASKLLPSTPAESACVEAGVLPFRWRIALVIFRRALGVLVKTYGNDESATLQTAQDIYLEFTGTALPPLARLHRVWPRPWNAQPILIDTSLSRTLRAGGAPEIAQATYNQLVARRYSSHTRIFTDGSKRDGEVGVGVSNGPTGSSFRLPTQCSVFSAEAAAIALALARRPSDSATTIFTDSLSVLRALENGQSRHPFVQAIEEDIDSLTTLCWIPGHCGIKGNAEADSLATRGRTARKVLTKEVPSQDIVRHFTQAIYNHFAQHWRTSRGYLQKIKGTPAKWDNRDSWKEQRVLSRLRTGHTKISHEHTVANAPVPSCTTCGTRKSVEHLLINWIELQDLRAMHDLPLSIRDALSNDPVREEVMLNFLKDSELYELI
ncbi:uncharacterized protein LOC131693322 [Topomyia yanbarensis]|uniref:uncharacterized protein LOC131693322 n=1 Tax=Topomyia yanbarensis TaxID=2498891 RepID=UPI00273B4EEA|nr:uncharacterized protein LOC131693322 [Topomyia yanbarensis]